MLWKKTYSVILGPDITKALKYYDVKVFTYSGLHTGNKRIIEADIQNRSYREAGLVLQIGEFHLFT